MENKCKNCGFVHTLSYCNRCGQVVINERFTTTKLLGDFIKKALDLDKGIFYTVYSMLIRPQIVIRDYIEGATKKYTNPAKYAFILIAIATFFIIKNNNLEKSVEEFNDIVAYSNQQGMEFQIVFVGLMKHYLQYFTLLFLPFFAIATKWLYRSFNYAEHLIMHCYVYGLISIITLPFIYADNPLFSILLPLFITLLFYAFVFRKLFRSSVIKSLIKSIVFYITGYLLICLALLVGTFLFLIGKKIITGHAF